MAAQPQEVAEAAEADPAKLLTSLLLTHAVPGALMASDLVDGMRVNTAAGGSVGVTRTRGGRVLIGGSRLLREEGRVDFSASNGFVHVIDDVIFPFEADGEDGLKPKRKRWENKLLGPVGSGAKFIRLTIT